MVPSRAEPACRTARLVLTRITKLLDEWMRLSHAGGDQHQIRLITRRTFGPLSLDALMALATLRPPPMLLRR